MGFELDVGHSSAAGARELNEDFSALVRPGAGDEALGWIAAIADGVSMGGGGREAAQTTVMSLVGDYHSTPPTWDTSVALDRLIEAQNRWLVDHNQRRHGDGGTALCTLTALVLRGQAYTVAHVGDTRAWRLREAGGGTECQLLTQDHSYDQLDFKSRLTRAIGLDDHVRVDYAHGELQVGDVFVLTSDGVHGVLKRARLAELAGQGSAQRASQALVDAALAAGSKDNVTAMVLRVQGLAAMDARDSLIDARHLPVPPRLKLGDVLDGYTVTALVADTGVHRLYQARDVATRELVAVKTLHESRASDPEERAMLAHEVWLARHVTERDRTGFIAPRESHTPTSFYAVFDWHSGQTLGQWLAQGRRFEVGEAVAGVTTVARALGRLHRQGIVHRDIKPDNLHLGEDGQWRVLDLGVAVSGREPKALRSLHAGTPSYMNPEQWAEDAPPADATSDLFALGVTLYQWLTGRLPYGEIEPYQTMRYRRDPRAPSRLRPDVPIWLDHIVLKAVARDAALRFETAEELVLALERGAARPLPAPGATPLVARDPAALWKIALFVSLLFNALLVVWLLFLPR